MVSSCDYITFGTFAIPTAIALTPGRCTPEDRQVLRQLERDGILELVVLLRYRHAAESLFRMPVALKVGQPTQVLS